MHATVKPLYGRQEKAVVLTSLEQEVLGIAQRYRDRADAENVWDELKNQWGWTGFTTHDHQRSQVLARIVALACNWWSLFTRLAIPNRHEGGLAESVHAAHAVCGTVRFGSATGVGAS